MNDYGSLIRGSTIRFILEATSVDPEDLANLTQVELAMRSNTNYTIQNLEVTVSPADPLRFTAWHPTPNTIEPSEYELILTMRFNGGRVEKRRIGTLTIEKE